jgi:hypothetical protein
MVSMKRFGYCILLVSISSLISCSASCQACDVPVCRYALEHWNPDAYQVAVLHKGPMDAGCKALITALEKRSLAPPRANLVVQTIDADHPGDESERALCQAHPCGDGPRVVVRYPAAARVHGTAWEGPLTAGAVAALADSPCRRDIADRLLGGDEMVWVLLQTGHKEADNAAAERIEQELKQPADEGQSPLRSSLVRVSRGDPAEQLLTETLLSTEPDLRGRDEPTAFPVFGRGRVLYALAGAGINAETVRHALVFLTGGCSCTVKRENPGVDLLLTADWSLITPTTPEETAPAPAAVIDLVPLTPLPRTHRQAPAAVEETPVRGSQLWLIGAAATAALLTIGTGWLALRSRGTQARGSSKMR